MTNSRQAADEHLVHAANTGFPIARHFAPPSRNRACTSACKPNQEIVKVFQKLSRAWQYSLDCERSRWDFAVELLNLDNDGVSHETLRWMIGKGLIEHGIETLDHQGIGRTFESPGGFTFSGRSCFVVTENGLDWQSENGLATNSNDAGTAHETPVLPVIPRWDDQRHELWLGTILVKRFKWKAVNQESVLAAFEEEGWPSRIDDPLSPVADCDPKRRLSDTIKCLNRKQTRPLIRFSGDGSGEGILWDHVNHPEFNEADGTRNSPPRNNGAFT